MPVETVNPDSNSSSEFKPAVPPDLLKPVDGVKSSAEEKHHKGPGRPPKPAPRKMGPHSRPSRSRGYEISHRKRPKTEAKASEDMVYPSEIGAFMIDQPESTPTKPKLPPKEGEPIIISPPTETAKELPGSPLEILDKESTSTETKSSETADETATSTETKDEKKPTPKPKRPSVTRRELRAQSQKPAEKSELKPTETKSDIILPVDWKVQDGSIELPDGRRIVQNVSTGETLIIQTKDGEGKDLPADRMKTIAAKDGESREEFLAREIPGVSKEALEEIGSRISQQTTHNKAESGPENIEDEADKEKAVDSSETSEEVVERQATEKTKSESLSRIEKITTAEVQKDEAKAEYLKRRYGVETEEDYIARLKERDILSPGQKGALTAERNKIQKYLESLHADGKELPQEYLARLQDLNLVLDNAKRFEPGIENTPKEEGEAPKSIKAWSVPALTTEKLLIPTTVETPVVVEPPQPPPGPPVVEPPVIVEPPIVEPPQPPPPGPPTIETTEVATLYALDARETDMARARLLADEQINREMREIREQLFEVQNPADNRFFRMAQAVARGVRSTFRHPVEAFRYVSRSTFLREGYRQRYIHEHFGGMEGPNFHNAVAEAIAQRFDLGEDYLQNGERILGEDRPEVRATKDRLNQIFEQGITGAIDRASVLAEAQRALAEAEWIGNGSDEHVHMVQNLEVIYDRIAASVEHEAGLGAIDSAYRLAGGETTLGVNAEADRTTTDRIMERLTDSRLKGWLVNEATVAVAVGSVVNIAGYLARSKGARIAAGALLGGPVGIVATAGSAALFSAARERATMRQERALRMGRVASGEEGLANNPDHTPRTAEIDATLYEMVAASDVLADYEAARPDDPSTMSEDEANNLRAWLISLRTNQTVGDEGNIDLIQYTSEDLVEAEKTDLMTARADAERILAQYALTHPDYMDAIPGATLEDKINSVVQYSAEQLVQGGISDADRAFRRLSNSRAAKRAVATFAFASAGSYISAQISEHFSGHRAAETITHEHVLPNQNVAYGFKGDSINMPQGWKLEGSAIIDAHGNKLVENIELRPDGGIPQTALDTLKGKGIGVSEVVQNHTTTVTREVPFSEYMALHPEKFHSVHREMWMGNDTPMYRDALGQLRGADLNELGGDFSLNPDGDIVLHTSRMTDSGSFWGAVRVAAHTEQVDGKLRWLFTPDKGNQSSSMILEVEPGGTVVIPKGSDIYSLFKVNPSASGLEQVKLNTGFAEVAYPTGRSTGGSENFMILATQAGDQPPGTVTITENVNFQTVQTTLAVNEVTTEVIPGQDWHAPFIPIAAPLPRRPLERVIPRGYHEPYLESPYLGYQAGEFSPEDEQRIRRRFSDRLRDNPDAVLDPREEIEGYISGMDIDRRDLLEDLSLQTEPMSESCEIVVGIPVNGAQEGRNIYNTLRWYSGQQDRDGNPLDPNKYEVVLFVNKPTNMEWDDTLAEIERFKADNPTVPIRVIQREYPPEQARIGRIRRDMTDVTLLRQGNRAVNKDVIVVSNDADCKGLGASYLLTILEQSEVQGADGLSGRLEWDPTTNTESPLYHMGVKFMQMLDLIDRHPSPGSGREARYRYPGANFAFRASTYAAVGGYDPGSVKAEDVVLGKTIKLARRGSSVIKGIGFYGGDNVVYTNSRRGITVFNQGYPPAAEWSRLTFGPNDAAREGAELEDPINYDVLLEEDPGRINKFRQERARRRFEAELSRFIEETLEEYRVISERTVYHEGMRMPTDVEIADRAVDALRIDATIDVSNGEVHVSIQDASRLYDYLRRYREFGLRNYMNRTDLTRIFPGGLPEVYPELAPVA